MEVRDEKIIQINTSNNVNVIYNVIDACKCLSGTILYK